MSPNGPMDPEPLSHAHPRVVSTLRDVFGHHTFRVGQAEIIDHILAAEPVLAVMPTGAGKSLCYQLPALVLDGLTVVVSPLIALINDQVGALKAKGIKAASLTSADSDRSSRAQLFSDLARGDLKLLYVAPERFRSEGFVSRMQGLRIGLLAIDEAHCISTWGHDFRPDYARLGGVIQRLAPPRVCALTATATPEVREDILRNLGLENAACVVTGFDRPNLELSVVEAHGAAKKLEEIDRALRQWLRPDPARPPSGSEGAGGARRSAIVYAATRKRSEEVAAGLAGRGWRAAAYHAGLATEDRHDIQKSFERDGLDAVVATTAFGMGVDKATVRCVVHYDIPSSPEGYYQEVGRAGRDGLPAAGVLLFDAGDLRWSLVRLESSCPTPAQVESAFDWLRARAGSIGEVPGGLDESAEALEPEVGLAARAAIVQLERIGAVAIERGAIVLRAPSLTYDASALEHRARLERGKLDAMVGYVQRATCRRTFLLDYFGDAHRPERCGVCDRCRRDPARGLEDEALLDALKGLSCVARMKGRYGRGRVADVLIGSRGKPVMDARLDQLSTYGLLSKWSREEVLELLDSLARANLVKSTIGEYPKIELTHAGAEALRSRAIAIDLRLRRWGRAEEPGGGAAVESSRRHLVDTFRAWRSEVASRIRKPAYIVAHDTVLEALAVLQPTTLAELASVPGIGPAKIERYGDEIVSIVRAHAEGKEAGCRGSC